jgi:hypothetical protein
MSAVIGIVAAAFVGKMLVPAGAKLLREAFGAMRSRGGSEALPQPGLVPLKRVASLPVMQAAITSAINESRGADLSTVKERVFDALAEKPLYTSDSERVRSNVAALRNAGTLADIRKAGKALAATVADEHVGFVRSGVRLATRNAAIKTGFAAIKDLPSPLGGEIIRFAATDQLGRSIVTEIDTRPDRDLKIDAEVVGVTDNSCQQILDNFYEALKEEGLVVSRPPARKPTGGICEMAATREFLKKKLSKAPVAKRALADTNAGADERRLQRNRAAAVARTKVTN